MNARLPHRLALMMLLGLLVISGCWRRSLSELDQAKQQLYEAKKERSSEKTERALDLCNRILAKSPDNFEALLLRGQVHEALLQDDQAYRDYTAAINADAGSFKGYAYRSMLLNKRADTASDEQQKEEWLAQAYDDHRESLARNPDAAIPALQRASLPPRAADSPDDEAESVAGAATGDDGILPATVESGDSLAGDDQAQNDINDDMPGEEAEKPRPATEPEKWLSNREDAKQIAELDLQESDDLPEPTLPPHTDPEERQPLPEVPVPPVVRFDLGAYPQITTTTPTSTTLPRPHTTGLVPSPNTDETGAGESDRILTRGPSGTDGGPRFSPFVTGPTIHTTGILGGSRPAADARSPSPTDQATFLSPWLAPPQSSAVPPSSRKRDRDPEGDSEAATRGKPAQILSMALPNSAPPPAISGTSLGLLPPTQYTPAIPTTGSNTLQWSNR